MNKSWFQGSADQIRPDLYEDGLGDKGEGGEGPGGEILGSIHFFMSYDVGSKSLVVRVIEAKDLPKPILLDASKQDNAHSNPYVKVSPPLLNNPLAPSL